jgi:hypothetical protein
MHKGTIGILNIEFQHKVTVARSQVTCGAYRKNKFAECFYRSQGTMTDVSRPPLYAKTTLFRLPRKPPFVVFCFSLTSPLTTVALISAQPKATSFLVQEKDHKMILSTHHQ